MGKFISLFIILMFIIQFSSIAATKQIKIMTYNTLNLFDTVHDQGKHDYTYLPLSVKSNSQEIQKYCKKKRGSRKNECLKLDWTRHVVKAKVTLLGQIISEGNPDVIILEEVENISVLKELMNTGLKNKGYKHAVLIEGPDVRGIDVGIISKLNFLRPPSLHNVDLASLGVDTISGQYPRPTRGILEVNFLINGKRVTIFGNHWPSQGNPDRYRMKAGKTLYNAIDPSDDLVIAMGDFNTANNDQLNGVKEYLLNPNRKFQFKDSAKMHFSLYPNSTVHRGTYFYRGKWGSLDKILILNNSNSIVTRWDKFNVIAKDFMINSRGPIRFNAKTLKGYSDHLPTLMSFDIN